jgi:hypothetical protein
MALRVARVPLEDVALFTVAEAIVARQRPAL